MVQALQSSLIEAKLERCYKAIDSVSHAEDTRRHRLQLLMLEDTNDELQDLLESESERFAELDGELQSAHLECEELRLGVQGHMWDVKSRERELELAQVLTFTHTSAPNPLSRTDSRQG